MALNDTQSAPVEDVIKSLEELSAQLKDWSKTRSMTPTDPDGWLAGYDTGRQSAFELVAAMIQDRLNA